MAPPTAPCLIWFRLDLRLAENPALERALRWGGPVIPCFVWSPEEEAPWSPGAASRWWLHHSLERLDAALRERGSQLVVRRGATSETLLALAAETGARAIYWNRRYEPVVMRRDAAVKQALREAGIEAESSNAALLHEPWTLQNKAGRPFQVFTPFWRAALSGPEPAAPLPAPPRLPGPSTWPRGETVESLGLLPTVAWDTGFRDVWTPGEDGALARLATFARGPLFRYENDRNRPDLPGSSRLSPHLHFGEIGPRQVWAAVASAAVREHQSPERWRASQFLAEIGWREFAHHLLYHFPQTPERPLRPEFERFPWRENPSGLRAWHRGRTGYPLVDAGMRELWGTGWMHNRVRMVAGSFLVKNLMIPWQEGARWFWDTLVDADLASNTLGWQWVSGCGADAAPYFRIFNPVSQGEKFDPQGDYVRRWVPELRGLNAPQIHAPFDVPDLEARAAGVRLGDTYPEPLVRHSVSRAAALAAYERMRK